MKTENMNSLVPKRGGLGTRPAATCQRLSKSMMDDSNEPEELHEQEIGDAESEGAGDESEGELSSDHGEEGEKEEEEKKGKGRKRKRKGSTHHRRKLRSKYESVEDFNLEARTAQSEELERIRRLKLQQTLTGEDGREESEKEKEEVEGKRLEGNGRSEEGQAGRREREGSGSPEVMVVDLTEVVEGDQGPSKDIEPIVIDSGSDSEDERSSAPSKKPHSASAQRQVLNKKYDWATPCADGKILVNVGHGPEEEDIFLSPQIAKAAKPHQVGGIRFLYDNIVESQSRFQSSTGFGCILAHSMGLGKTLQVIAFIDIFLRHTPARHVLCIVPVNTLQNWVAEFDCWLPIYPGANGVINFKGSSRSTIKQGSPLEASSPSRSPLNSTQNSLSKPASLMVASPPEKLPLSAPNSPSPALLSVGPTSLSSSLPSSPSTSQHPPGKTQTRHSASDGSASTSAQPSHKDSSVNGAATDTIYRSFKLFVLSESVRTMDTRQKVISQWRKEGGVLLMGYEMYRLLALSVPSLGGNKMASKRRKPAKNQQPQADTTINLDETEREMDALIEIQQALCRPGPDLVICDEGHRIKNDVTNISQALKKIRTRRRIVMTGYPLQNNLTEYWCMVDFVRPNYLGTKPEFADLFERPITNGQCVDSTPSDVCLMRYRSHVLHALLEGFVLRRGHEILRVTLPPKFEHTVFLRPSTVQAVLYNYNMNQMQGVTASSNAGPLRAFAVCSKIWNHPDIYYTEAMAQDSRRVSPTSWLDEAGLPKSLFSKSEPDSLCKIDWPSIALSNYKTGLLSNSPKMVVMMELIDRSVQLGDRVLVFSQSLSTLSYVEKLLAQHFIPIPHSTNLGGAVQYSTNKWTKGKNYCRLDGSTGSMERDRLINFFNSPANTECWLFLLSTRAGCLGVNLVGANRVIVLDVSWNPCYDIQAVCRVYRYGQVKPTFIYRLVCDGTMEKKIYDRQISKQGMSDRVVDELHPERHFTLNDIITLVAPLAPLPHPPDLSALSGTSQFSDPLLVDVCRTCGHLLTKLPFKHESLLISKDESLSDVEKYVALKGFQHHWNALRSTPGQNYTFRTQPTIRPQQRVTPGPPAATAAPAVHTTVSTAVPQVVTDIQKMPTVRLGTLPQTTHGQTAVRIVPPATHSQTAVRMVPPATLGQTAARVVPPATLSQTRGGGGGDVEVICLDSDSEDESPSAQQQGFHSNSTPVAGEREGGFPPNVVVSQQPSSVGTLRASETCPSNTSLLLGRPQAAIITSRSPANPVLAATIANILASAKDGGIQVGNLMAAAHTSPPRSVSLSLASEGGGGGGGREEAASTSQADGLGVFPTQAGTVTSQVASPKRPLAQPQPSQNPSSLFALHMVSSAHTTSPQVTTAQSTSHTSTDRASAAPQTAVPLLSPIAARLFNHSMNSPTASSSSSLPVLTPLPPSSTARKTAIVPPYCAIVTSLGNLPSTSSQPQLHTSGASGVSVPPVSKNTTVDSSKKAEPHVGSQQSIVLD